jgi:hypothetical protein
MKPITDIAPNEPSMREQFERMQEIRNEGAAVHKLDGTPLNLWAREEFRKWLREQTGKVAKS